MDLITEFIIIGSRSHMFVCICRAVTEEKVKASIDAGARSVDAVTRSCHAGTDCGACRGMIDDLIDERWGTAAAADTRVCLPLVAERAA
jgi:bacterioferritin-associated ferredoxin